MLASSIFRRDCYIVGRTNCETFRREIGFIPGIIRFDISASQKPNQYLTPRETGTFIFMNICFKERT